MYGWAKNGLGDDVAVLQSTLDNAKSNAGSAVFLGAGILFGVMWLVFRKPKRNDSKIWR